MRDPFARSHVKSRCIESQGEPQACIHSLKKAKETERQCVPTPKQTQEMSRCQEKEHKDY